MYDSFDVFITADQSFRNQQKHDPTGPALIVLAHNHAEAVMKLAPQILQGLGYVRRGQIVCIPAGP